MRSASTSASCLACTYGHRRSAPRGNGWRSSAVEPRGAGPIAATDDVWTTRSTPARSASSSTIRVPSTLTRHSCCRLRGAQRGQAGDVEDAVDAAQRAAHGAAVEDVALDALDVEVGEVVARERSRTVDPHVVAALDEQPGDVRPDQARAPGDAASLARAAA